MRKSTSLLIFVFILLISSVSAVCTLTLDKSIYIGGETATASMLCDDAMERSKSYTVTWRNNTAIVETDLGTTPSSSIYFFETLDIPFNTEWTSANVTLTGTNLEGVAYFSVTGNSSKRLSINNATFTQTAFLGENYAIDFQVKDSNDNTINNAHCFIYGTDITGAPLEGCGEVHTHDGRGSCDSILDSERFNENENYLARIRCNCDFGDHACSNQIGEKIEGYSGSTSIPFTTSKWLTINTVTDKSSYVYGTDKEVRVCANVSNANDRRVNLEIFYSYRCNGNNQDTNRILIDSHDELRGISANTTQMQCARLDIINYPSIQNNVNSCYASTDVRVLGKDPTVYFTTYATTSPLFNLTSTSSTDSYLIVPGDNMIAISILLVSFMFFLIYLSTKISIKDDDGQVVPLNAMIVMILWSAASFVAYLITQLALAVALTNSMSEAIVGTIRSITIFVWYAGLILLMILIIGILINVSWNAIEWVNRNIINRRRK